MGSHVTVHIPPSSQREIRGFSYFAGGGVNDYVLIAYTELDPNLKPIAGEVLAHSIDRDIVYDALLHRGDRGVAASFIP